MAEQLSKTKVRFTTHDSTAIRNFCLEILLESCHTQFQISVAVAITIRNSFHILCPQPWGFNTAKSLQLQGGFTQMPCSLISIHEAFCAHLTTPVEEKTTPIVLWVLVFAIEELQTRTLRHQAVEGVGLIRELRTHAPKTELPRGVTLPPYGL